LDAGIPLNKKRILLAFAILFLSPWHGSLRAQDESKNACQRPAAGSVIPEPTDLRSRDGVLKVDLTIHKYGDSNGSTRYCYMDAQGNASPTLRLNPGDLLILNLKNEMGEAEHSAATPKHIHPQMRDPDMNGKKMMDGCTVGSMNSASTNLHFHGLTVPPVCHQDDVLNTSISPGDSPFEYRFRIPDNEPPGLYWYHPHIHGFSKAQVLGGASGALIVEGIERANKEVAGLPERVLIIRDQDLLNPNAPPSKSEPRLPPMLIDHDGDAVNNGTGFGRPAKDLSINFVPVPYPDYPPAVIKMRPGERQLWRVLNASAITYLNLAVLFNRVPQQLGLVALDGVPLNENRAIGDFVDWQTHLGVPPGARVEFIVNGPPQGGTGLLVTRSVDTGPGGENDPNRAIAAISVSADAPEPPSKLSATPDPLPAPALPWLGNEIPVQTRRLYFSEKLSDPKNPNSAMEFYITVDGQTPALFDPHSRAPNIVAKQGTVEDWIIENRSSELHAFHIHQMHFMLLDYLGKPVNEPYLRDTVNVPYDTGKALVYPSIKLRMDFRDPNTVGTFVYHCHLLEHEDGGMMGLIRVDAADDANTISSRNRAVHVNPSHTAGN
jgi:FtsP/CotA-like multicopper oxidase with cupredoxin domain